MIQQVLTDTNNRMQKAIDALTHDLSGIAQGEPHQLS